MIIAQTMLLKRSFSDEFEKIGEILLSRSMIASK